MKSSSFFIVAFALGCSTGCGPVPENSRYAHPVAVRKVQRVRAMEHARRRGR